MVVPPMDKAYVIRFKPAGLGTQFVTAASVEIHDEHIVLMDSRGKLAALFMTEIVESWSEIPLVRHPMR